METASTCLDSVGCLDPVQEPQVSLKHAGTQIFDVPKFARKAMARFHYGQQQVPHPVATPSLKSYADVVTPSTITWEDHLCVIGLRLSFFPTPPGPAPCAPSCWKRVTSSNARSKRLYYHSTTGTWPRNLRSFAPGGATPVPRHGASSSCQAVSH